MEQFNKDKREIASKPGNDFIGRINEILAQLDEFRAMELQSPNVTPMFERCLRILLGELISYFETEEEEKLLELIEQIELAPFGFHNKQVKNMWKTDIVFEWDLPEGHKLYKTKWVMMNKLEYGLRNCIRRNNFDVYEQKTKTRPF